MFIRDLADVESLFALHEGSFSGVGITAYSRIIPASFLQPYHIIALRKTRDLPLLKEQTEIFCLEEEMGQFVEEEGFNSFHLLSHPSIKKFIQGMPEPRYLLLYQSYPQLEELARREGWILIANPASLRMRMAERAFFHKMADKLRLNRIPGDIYPLNHITSRDYNYWSRTIDPKFVVQFPEIRAGGGKGTFFIKSITDYQRLRDALRGGTWRGVRVKSIAIRKFVDGVPASLALCLTRHGILFSGLQRQLIDLPYCDGLLESGIFCGHSWGEAPWTNQMQEEALRQARLIGAYLAGLGYKGILGIDFLISQDKRQIYPLECNPRFTGAFPMLSQLHLSQDVIPMDVFHMLEFLGWPYQMDCTSLNERYAEAVKGSHIILFALRDAILRVERGPEAGLYELDLEGNSEMTDSSFLQMAHPMRVKVG
jgi:hypothetical protein